MKASLFVLIITLSITGCTIDNYDMPELTFAGKIVDSETNKLVESAGNNSGSIIRLYEGASPQPFTCRTLSDGTFINSRVFAGDYSYEVEGPFTPLVATRVNIEIRKDVNVDIKVIPHLRVNATLAELTGTTAKVKVNYEKVNTAQALAQLAVIWSEYPAPNLANTTPLTGGFINENVTSLNLTTGEKIFTISNLKPKTKYYIRGAGRTNNTGNYFNYSTQFEIQTQ